MAIKRSGAPRLLIPLEDGKHEVTNCCCVPIYIHICSNILITESAGHQSNCELELQMAPRVSSIFEHGLFEVHARLENRAIKANCLTCQRMGRANLIQAREYSSSNLLAHLKVSGWFGTIKLCYFGVSCAQSFAFSLA